MPEDRDISEDIRTAINNLNPAVSVSTNIGENYIVTTEDKARILYYEYNEAKKKSSDALALFGIFMTLLVADVTCEFNAFWVFDANTVKAVFYVSTVFFLFLFGRAIFFWKKYKYKLQFDFFIKELQGNTSVTDKKGDHNEYHQRP